MCGIVGVLRSDGAPVDLERLRRATDALSSRGPDDVGWLLVDTRGRRAVACGGERTPGVLGLPGLASQREGRFDLALGFRRLAILDLSPAAHQPMADPEGRRFLVFNGEIYNYLELRPALEARGWRFRSSGDSEVLLAACALEGRAALPRLVGMFAFAFLDLADLSLTLARDAFGIKPLYWSRFDGGLAFASELPALLELPEVSRRVDPQHLYDYLRFGLTDHDGGTLLAGVSQLAPAHSLRIDLEKGRPGEPEAFWRLEPRPRADLSFDEAASRLRDLFLESVRLHLRSDVPVGTALSGGIDSSAVAMAVHAVQDRPVERHAICYAADDPALDELHHAREVAARSGSALHEVRIGAADLLADLDALVAAQGEPFGSTSIYAQYRVMRRARESGVAVMLDGQGADELFAGYRSYLGPRLAGLLARGELRGALAFARASSRLPGTSLRDVVLRAGARLLPDHANALARRLSGEELVPGWLDGRWLAERGVRPGDPWQPGSRRDALREQLRQAVTRASLPMLLRYEDRNSMAFSIESRVPFLTPQLAEFALSLPDSYLIDERGVSKAVLRRALRGLVPDSVLDRSDKIGFATPERRWLDALGPRADAVFAAATAEPLPALSWPRLRREWQAIREGRARFDFRAWRWLNLALWARRFAVVFD